MATTNTSEATSGIHSPVLSEPDAANYIGISRRTLRSLIAAGAVPVIRLSPRRIGFIRADLDAYLDRQRQA